jgi:hypothetical protein
MASLSSVVATASSGIVDTDGKNFGAALVIILSMLADLKIDPAMIVYSEVKAFSNEKNELADARDGVLLKFAFFAAQIVEVIIKFIIMCSTFIY